MQFFQELLSSKMFIFIILIRIPEMRARRENFHALNVIFLAYQRLRAGLRAYTLSSIGGIYFFPTSTHISYANEETKKKIPSRKQ